MAEPAPPDPMMFFNHLNDLPMICGFEGYHSAVKKEIAGYHFLFIKMSSPRSILLVETLFAQAVWSIFGVHLTFFYPGEDFDTFQDIMRAAQRTDEALRKAALVLGRVFNVHAPWVTIQTP